jgi:hypothetical protein
MRISRQKTKVMAFHGKYPIRIKIIIDNNQGSFSGEKGAGILKHN